MHRYAGVVFGESWVSLCILINTILAPWLWCGAVTLVCEVFLVGVCGCTLAYYKPYLQAQGLTWHRYNKKVPRARA